MTERVPRTTGEILSDSIALLRRHFKVFYVMALPFCAANVLLSEAAQSAFAVLKNLDPTRAGTGDLVTVLGSAVGGLGLLFGGQLAVVLASVASTAMASAGWERRVPTVPEALRAVADRGAATVLTTLLVTLLLLAAFVPALAAAVGAVVGFTSGERAAGVAGGVAALALFALGIIGFVFLFLRWSLITPAIVVEGCAGTGALRRSKELTAGRGLPFFAAPKFRVSMLYLVVFAISGPLQSLFALPRLFIAMASGWSIADGLPPLASMPIWFIIPFGLLQVASTTLIIPFSGALMTLFYYDLRVRYEALDLEPAAPSPP